MMLTEAEKLILRAAPLPAQMHSLGPLQSRWSYGDAEPVSVAHLLQRGFLKYRSTKGLAEGVVERTADGDVALMGDRSGL